MICKAFEVRDEGTHLPVLAVKLLPHDERERLILDRAGYGQDVIAQGHHVLLISLADRSSFATTDPHGHYGGRTLKHAHFHIDEYFDTLPSGSVIDVQYLLGETQTPVKTELKGPDDADV